MDDFFNHEQRPSGHGGAAARADVDIDTLPNLEPYRREVVAQQPITFGHRPSSASRMFNPCTMATSCGVQRGKGQNGRGTGGRARETSSTRGTSKTRQQSSLKRSRDRDSKTHRTTGISPPMLKALLKGDAEIKPSVATASHEDETWREGCASARGKSPPESAERETYLVLDGQEDLSDPSDSIGLVEESMWRSVDPAGGGVRGDLEATWFTNASQEGLGQGRLGLRDSVEARELQRIFSAQVREEASAHVDSAHLRETLW